jgi:uncharacterized oxidoreductase
MKLTGNTILITGGGSGIGEALAQRLHDRGNTVIVAGRRQEALDRAIAGRPHMHALVLDVESGEGVADFADRLLAAHPAVNVLVNNAGIMRSEVLDRARDLADAEATIATNLLGPIRLIDALVEHLSAQPDAAIVNVTSGLAFVPLTTAATYCATKAAIHSYSQSLRQQLKGTPVQVIELAPPYVQTELMGSRQANDPNAMPLGEFIDEVFALLTANPDIEEVLVERVKPLRFAEANGAYAQTFAHLNAMNPH